MSRNRSSPRCFRLNRLLAIDRSSEFVKLHGERLVNFSGSNFFLDEREQATHESSPGYRKVSSLLPGDVEGGCRMREGGWLMQPGYRGHGPKKIVDPRVSLPRHEMLILSSFLLNTARTFSLQSDDNVAGEGNVRWNISRVRSRRRRHLPPARDARSSIAKSSKLDDPSIHRVNPRFHNDRHSFTIFLGTVRRKGGFENGVQLTGVERYRTNDNDTSVINPTEDHKPGKDRR